MKSRKLQFTASLGVALIGLLSLGAMKLPARTAENTKPAPKPAAASQQQLTFATPADASAALFKAVKAGDQAALQRILGSTMAGLLSMSTPQEDKASMVNFVAKYDLMNRLVDMSDGTRVLLIGADNFAFPVPIARNASNRWYFDETAGALELRAREIGRNELLAIDACSALATAEEIYFNEAGATPEYTQRIVSTPGKLDGLYWPATEKDGVSPVGHLSRFPRKSIESLQPNQPFVADGYSFRILAGQGDAARDAAMSYIENARMSAGFAILAVPLKYGETGIMTFMISREGMVYERDFGPDTAKITGDLHEYNPDENWSLVE